MQNIKARFKSKEAARGGSAELGGSVRSQRDTWDSRWEGQGGSQEQAGARSQVAYHEEASLHFL